jgi:hypothetical protein
MGFLGQPTNNPVRTRRFAWLPVNTKTTLMTCLLQKIMTNETSIAPLVLLSVINHRHGRSFRDLIVSLHVLTGALEGRTAMSLPAGGGGISPARCSAVLPATLCRWITGTKPIRI